MKIETKRLVLRNIKKKDADSLRRNINNLNVSKWLLVVPYPYTKKDALWWINRCLEKQKEKPRKSYDFHITIKPNSEVVGGAGLSKVDLKQGTAEAGYWLAEKYWRQGYGFEAVSSVINFAFKKLKLRKITIPVFADNKASNGLAKKLGANLEGTLRKQVISKASGKLHDENIYGLLKEEWRKS